MIECRRPEVQELTAQKAAVYALFADVLKTNFPYANSVSEKAEESFSSLIRYVEEGSAIVYCVFQENAIVGLLWAYKRSFMGALRIHVDEFVVSPACRGKGLGRLLMAALEEYAAAEGIAEIDLLVSAASESGVAFYQQNGFVNERFWMKKNVRHQE